VRRSTTNQPTNQPFAKPITKPSPRRRNPLASFDPLQLLALRVLAQALRDAGRHGQAAFEEETATRICNTAELLAWLDSDAGILWWDLARLPWYDAAARRLQLLQSDNLRVLEL